MKFFGKCPGNDIRNLKILETKCKKCGNNLEYFSDEKKIKCKKCNFVNSTKSKASCVDWCKASHLCSGKIENQT